MYRVKKKRENGGQRSQSLHFLSFFLGFFFPPHTCLPLTFPKQVNSLEDHYCIRSQAKQPVSDLVYDLSNLSNLNTSWSRIEVLCNEARATDAGAEKLRFWRAAPPKPFICYSFTSFIQLFLDYSTLNSGFNQPHLTNSQSISQFKPRILLSFQFLFKPFTTEFACTSAPSADPSVGNVPTLG
jgi:hypothetical protein